MRTFLIIAFVLFCNQKLLAVDIYTINNFECTYHYQEMNPVTDTGKPIIGKQKKFCIFNLCFYNKKNQWQFQDPLHIKMKKPYRLKLELKGRMKGGEIHYYSNSARYPLEEKYFPGIVSARHFSAGTAILTIFDFNPLSFMNPKGKEEVNTMRLQKRFPSIFNDHAYGAGGGRSFTNIGYCSY